MGSAAAVARNEGMEGERIDGVSDERQRLPEDHKRRGKEREAVRMPLRGDAAGILARILAQGLEGESECEHRTTSQAVAAAVMSL